MSLTKLLPVILLMMATGVQASTRDEIERLWNPQGMAVQPAQPAADTSARTEKPASRWFRLSNGRQVNLADWKVVLFMQGRCPYCHQFDPVLKQLAQQYGFSVFPYTLDGQGDTAFPEALPVPPDVMQTFFPNIPVATPTTFLVNVNTLEALPLLQGATDAASFMARMDTVRKRTARAVLTGMCYSAGSAMRHGSSSLTRLTGQSAMTPSTWRR
ncbi:conjugal transfer protein TrbB [Klebsiella pneumoniae]|uniref:Conjugal transfer protein TrbB n=1 Tax=Klebsiella pneumoniae TaxID=573 RepID=A0A377ZNM9_KLEPN|nr:conjugal transfer protein TrbB [Klebsiella pneumoniae]STW25596.1 conjugal transfer protein TrbB [Klebsiella pneumoniae]STW25721.1 conjugal transfer protein TrbB [Klebsiella pneumoniae]